VRCLSASSNRCHFGYALALSLSLSLSVFLTFFVIFCEITAGARDDSAKFEAQILKSVFCYHLLLLHVAKVYYINCILLKHQRLPRKMG
jgi:hypothetical protein